MGLGLLIAAKGNYLWVGVITFCDFISQMRVSVSFFQRQ